MRYKPRLFIISNPLFFTGFYMSLHFIFFEIYLKKFLDLVIYSFVENFKRYLLIKRSVSSRAPPGMGWDEKNRPMGQNFSSRRMWWDSSQNFHPTMGWDTSKKCFVPWDGMILWIFRPVPFHPMLSHGMAWDSILIKYRL
jgi:hypothetical protein